MVGLDRADAKAVERLAADRGLSVSAVLRELIGEGIASLRLRAEAEIVGRGGAAIVGRVDLDGGGEK